MENKIRTIFNNIFCHIDPNFKFSMNLSRENYFFWDSLRHIELMVEIEKTFEVRLNGAVIVRLISVNHICKEFS